MKYIKDDGVVRNCAQNVAKMNVFEYIYYGLFHWRMIQIIFGKLIDCLMNVFSSIICLFIILLSIITFPILIFIEGLINIKISKKIMKKLNKK